MQRVRVQVRGQGPRHDDAVVVRFVAVPVKQDDVIGGQQRLQHNFVRRRGPVGDEVRVLGAVGLSRPLLGILDGAGRVQKGIQAATSGTALRTEDVHPVEVHEVVQPIGLQQRRPTADGHGMEHSNGPRGVRLQCGEEWRVGPLLDLPQQSSRQLAVEIVACKEHPPHVLREIAVVQRPLTDQIDVNFGPNCLDGSNQMSDHLVWLALPGSLPWTVDQI
mmetsp:Transcript_37921/g.62882  ORF Transcript_37921/g.62882 Transcript_37921/m.62882 type:complete len:219 (+) Transcript_37921:1860-2516(+)